MSVSYLAKKSRFASHSKRRQGASISELVWLAACPFSPTPTVSPCYLDTNVSVNTFTTKITFPYSHPVTRYAKEPPKALKQPSTLQLNTTLLPHLATGCNSSDTHHFVATKEHKGAGFRGNGCQNDEEGSLWNFVMDYHCRYAVHLCYTMMAW